MTKGVHTARRPDTLALLPTSAAPGAHPHLRNDMSTSPTGIRAPEATSAPPGARPARRVHNSPCLGIGGLHPMGSRATSPISQHRGARPKLQLHTSSRSTGTRAPSTTSTPPAARPQQHFYRSPHSFGSPAPAPTSKPPGARTQQRPYTSPPATDTRAPSPIAAPPGSPPWRECCRFVQIATGNHSPQPRRTSRGTCKTPRCPPAAPLRCRRREVGLS